MDHNAPCLPTNLLYNHRFQFLLGITVNPREIQDNGYVKFWGENKVLYMVYVKMVNTNFFFKVSKKINRFLR